MKLPELDVRTIDRVVEMPWEDRTPFDAITFQFGLPEKDLITLMRQEMKRSSYQMWRKRVTGRKTKHLAKRNFDKGRFRCKEQK